MTRVRDAPATVKILLIAIILILLPGAVLSYVSYISVNERARRLEAGYRGTLYMVRDRFELDVLRLEQALLTSLDSADADLRSLTVSRQLLTRVAANHPWLRRPFLADADGALVTASTSLGWLKPPTRSISLAPALEDLISRAEAAEFLHKDSAGALRLYARALEPTRSAEERAEVLSRIGRCHFKLGDYRGGIEDYRKLLDLSQTAPTVGEIPTFIVALSQLADGYAAAKDDTARIDALLQLHQRLVDSPWDVAATACEYYLKQTSRDLEVHAATLSNGGRSVLDAHRMGTLKRLETDRLENARHLDWIRRTVLPEMQSEQNRNLADASVRHISAKRERALVSVGYFRMDSAAPDRGPWTLGYELNEDHLVGSLLPRILEHVDLGGDIRIAILDEAGQVRFPRVNPASSGFLAAGHFVEILPSWQVVVFHPDGRSINELAWREKATSLAFLGGTLVVMILGISLTVRAAAHEVALSKLKSDFVSNVSHELKTPLALIRMFGETLESDLVEDEAKRREFYRIIRAESERLTHLINKVLDFSRIDAGVKQYNFRETDLVEVIRHTLETYRFQIRDLGFTIDTRLPSRPAIGHIDPDAVSEALLNLLDNATKYSGDSRQIEVSVTVGASSATVSVGDHGVGIPKDDLPNIFDKFYRARTERTCETPGSGLGLALVKHIVEAHGGRVEVESEPGRGSRFSFVIPVEGQPPAEVV